MVHVRHGGDEAQGVDPGGVRETRGAVDEGKLRDRSAVETQEVESLLRARDVRRADERQPRRLHLDDDRQEPQRIGLHHGQQRGVDLVGDERVRAGRAPDGHEHEGEDDERAADPRHSVPRHVRGSTGPSEPCSGNGREK